MHFRFLPLLLSAGVLLPLAGCGSSDSASDTGADPATLVPADAPVYAEAIVRPEGDLRSGAEDALKKILRTDDPGARIEGLLDDASKGEQPTWDDVKEWLGPRAGVFATEFGPQNPAVAGVLNITDADKAREDLEAIAKQAKDPSFAYEIVDDFAVVGTQPGVDAVKAVADGGQPLSDVDDYKEAREAVSADDDLGVVYLEPQGLLDTVGESLGSFEGSREDNERALEVFRQAFAQAGRAAAAGFHADGDALGVDGAALGAKATPTSGQAAESVRGLPADAWLAVGFGDLGRSLTDALAQFEQIAGAAGEGTPDFEALLGMFEQRTGVDVREDFLSWMGAGAIYARGRSIADIGGALTIETKDPARSTKAVGILARGLSRTGGQVRDARVEGYDIAIELRDPEAPVSLLIAANDERFTLGINPQALAAVADPAETLGDSESYAAAKESLGGLDPVAIVDTPTVVNLLETFGLGDVEGYDKVRPYLQAFGPIAAGSQHDGDVSRASFAVGLR